MATGSPLLSVLVVLVAALISATIFVRLKQPNIIGYLIGGLIIGPYGFGLVPYENVELLAEIGIGFLMFTVGLELSIPQLIRVKYVSILGGSLILGIVCLASIGIAPLVGWTSTEAFLWGATLGLSSTVVVLKLLHERGEVGSQHGNVATGILLFQDVVSIPLLVMIPFLAHSDFATQTNSLLGVLARLILFLSGIILMGRVLVPKFLHFVAHSHSKELFSLSVLAITMGTAALTSQMGLSLALGAFVAGLIVSESDFGNQAASEVLPLKDAFGAIFFVSVGMLLNFAFLVQKWPTFLVGLISVVTVKFTVVLFVCFLFRCQSKIATFVAIALSQIGEFGFLIILEGKKSGILSTDSHQKLLGISILSMIATPYFLKSHNRVKKIFSFMNRMEWIRRTRLSFFSEERSHPETPGEKKKAGFFEHVIICGYGPTGSHVAKNLQDLGFTVVIVDLNYRSIQTLKDLKQNAIYGDSASTNVLEAAGLEKAILMVVTIPDPSAMKALVRKVKKLRPGLPIIMRVKYMSDRDKLLSLGADDIVWEEQESGKELIVRAKQILNITGV